MAENKRENFGGRFAIIMAMAGSAIGLGNIWRFPYLAGEHGGAAFILVYILSSVFLSLPIFLSESIIGRRSKSNTYGAMKKLAPGTRWKWLSIITILAYTAIAGAVGAGGLGDLAIRYGYQRSVPSMMWVTVILIIVLVQVIQSLFSWLSTKMDKRLR